MTTNNRLNNSTTEYSFPNNAAWILPVTAGNNVTGDGTRWTCQFDSGGTRRNVYINNANGQVTVPTSGLYYVGAYLTADNFSSSHTSIRIFLKINSTEYTCVELNPQLYISGSYMSICGSWMLNLSASDILTMVFVVFGSSATIHLDGGIGNTGFWGTLIA